MGSPSFRGLSTPPGRHILRPSTSDARPLPPALDKSLTGKRAASEQPLGSSPRDKPPARDPGSPRPTRDLDRAPTPAGEAKAAGRAERAHTDDNPPLEKVQRFRRCERMLHWAIAVPFLLCAASAIVLVLVYNLHPLRPHRALFSWIHRLSGACLVTIPVLVVFRNRRDRTTYLENVREAWSWGRDDLRWLSLQVAAAAGREVTLPEAGKFNAGQKMNLMMVMLAWPLLAATGATIWLADVPFVAWIFHFLVATIALPIVAGHIYLAVIHPGTRKGLPGMITGFVDREWARHHYPRWYRERFGSRSGVGIGGGGSRPLESGDLKRFEAPAGRRDDPLQRPARIHCSSCGGEQVLASWATLLDRLLAAEPLLCPRCGVEMTTVRPVVSELDLVGPILEHLERKAWGGPPGPASDASARHGSGRSSGTTQEKQGPPAPAARGRDAVGSGPLVGAMARRDWIENPETAVEGRPHECGSNSVVQELRRVYAGHRGFPDDARRRLSDVPRLQKERGIDPR